MSDTFDLLYSPWIPCIERNGRLVELGLRDVLVRAHTLTELVGESPLVTAALHRLLLAVLHRVFGPADYEEWADLWHAGAWDASHLDAYASQWRHRFDLFDPLRPFFQATDPRVKAKPVNRLLPEVASGNNPTLFDHHTHEAAPPLTPAEAARALVALQLFGLGGLSGLPEKFTDAPCSGVIVFLVQGETLFETLMLNSLPYPDSTRFLHTPDDCPAWETDDVFTRNTSLPSGYLDYLTWQNRRVLLLPANTNHGIVVEQITEAPALRLDQGVLDPMVHYRRDEQRGLVPLAFSEGRALWRDSAALFRLNDPGFRPPQTFRLLAELVYEGILEVSQTRRYLALGMSKKQAKVNFCRTERMPLPFDYLSRKDRVDALVTALNSAESTARQLWSAARTLAKFLLAPEADATSARQSSPDEDNLLKQWAVEGRYWSRLELPFRHTVEVIPRDPEGALAAWNRTVWKTAWDAFEQVTDNLGHDPRTLKALVRAREQLEAGLSRVLPSLQVGGNP